MDKLITLRVLPELFKRWKKLEINKAVELRKAVEKIADKYERTN